MLKMKKNPDTACIYCVARNTAICDWVMHVVFSCRSLAGGAMFITTVIMATVIIITKKGTSNVGKILLVCVAVLRCGTHVI